MKIFYGKRIKTLIGCQDNGGNNNILSFFQTCFQALFFSSISETLNDFRLVVCKGGFWKHQKRDFRKVFLIAQRNVNTSDFSQENPGQKKSGNDSEFLNVINESFQHASIILKSYLFRLIRVKMLLMLSINHLPFSRST